MAPSGLPCPERIPWEISIYLHPGDKFADLDEFRIPLGLNADGNPDHFHPARTRYPLPSFRGCPQIQTRKDSRRTPTFQRELPGRISGAAFITDGDGLKVDGHVIRMAGVDAPEHDQPARGSNGKWFNQGKRVNSELIQKIGGRNVEVVTQGRDRHGRVLGTVFCDSEDINKWLILRRFAIAACGRQYRSAERWARKMSLGMW